MAIQFDPVLSNAYRMQMGVQWGECQSCRSIMSEGDDLVLGALDGLTGTNSKYIECKNESHDKMDCFGSWLLTHRIPVGSL